VSEVFGELLEMLAYLY